MAKILYAGCLGLSLVFSAQFTLEICAATRNHEIPRSYKAPWTIQTFIKQISEIPRSRCHEWQTT